MNKLLKLIIIIIIIIIIIYIFITHFKNINGGGGELNQYDMMIISKYFKRPQDYINMSMINSKYKDIPNKFLYNPISIDSTTLKKLFPNIETQHIYKTSDPILKNNTINKYIDHITPISYSQFLDNETNYYYKHIILTRDDVKEYNLNTIPEHVTEIGEKAFYNDNNLTSLDIPEGVEVIRKFAFCDCVNLQSVTFPSTLKIIGECAFAHSVNLRNVIIPEGVKIIMAGAFAYSGLISVTIPEGIKRTSKSTFANCNNLKSVILPSTLKIINNTAFSCCDDLQNIIIPEGVEVIESLAFENCTSLKTVTLPSTLKRINKAAFINCVNLENVENLENVNINYNAFENCPNLVSRIPNAHLKTSAFIAPALCNIV